MRTILYVEDSTTLVNMVKFYFEQGDYKVISCESADAALEIIRSEPDIDAFIFDKPVINPVFGNVENKLFDDQKFLNYAHLTKLVESHSTIIVKNEKEFLTSINNILRENDNKKGNREKFLKLQISKPLEGTSKRIVETLLKISNE